MVIIEVLSDSTRRADLGEKRDAYLTIPSLKVLIFVESGTPAVIVHCRKSEGGFAVEAHSGLDAVIPLPEIDASLPLAELYEQVEFARLQEILTRTVFVRVQSLRSPHAQPLQVQNPRLPPVPETPVAGNPPTEP